MCGPMTLHCVTCSLAIILKTLNVAKWCPLNEFRYVLKSIQVHSKGCEDESVISFQFLQRFEEKISCQGIHCKLGPKELWVKSETIVFLFFGLQNKFRENRLDFILHITHSNISHFERKYFN